ncbi:hypothetical protein RHSIM_Rhsim07G0073000 [Rhododendron simsii]|uniref:Uncharacterized protein n=1 Tax=Rhododendron simsii TaxID=118357 RepID=A0A834H185_RHOSS|nr:hypothetical protein RHSIM_Rhsim07G0073000 [Rhododendron simsii]
MAVSITVSPEVRSSNSLSALALALAPSEGDEVVKGGISEEGMISDVPVVDVPIIPATKKVKGRGKGKGAPLIDRRVLWADMKSLAPVIGDTPWLQLGEFNVVRRLSEWLVGFDNSASLEFNSCR